MVTTVEGESIQVDELFQYSACIQLPICRQCRHAVWPEKVADHVRRREHRLSARDARHVQKQVSEWPHLLHDRDVIVKIHEYIRRPVPELDIFTDGKLCNIQTERCRYVCRDEASMKVHWAQHHPGQRGKAGAPCSGRRSNPTHIRRVTLHILGECGTECVSVPRPR
ncbi:hypothetical protein A1O3_07793 [Capronia epimyces CBS 606.96]|uniref:Uncharacterized protein n=1 Tax=Capronia epimyces CBS 606.96 TaxID=1182542 RepID=W9YAW5_9EURO|nr:uncharacterized protein A1O3_07793 [Capronia epimyces CBS 606.96]EXJ79514.1 hypothetical protein A1O3_07793 [Capronia epimyces CBS 606.96]